MSQYSPNPAAHPPSPPYPQQPYGVPAPAARGNGFAVASLVCGLIFCVPFITGGLAVLFGFLGLKRSKETNTGSSMSIVGLVLGAVNVIVWALFWGTLYTAIAGLFGLFGEVKQTNETFIRDVAGGNIAAAMSATDGSIPEAEMVKLSNTLKSWGPVSDITTSSIQITNNVGRLGGTVTFGSTVKPFQATLVKSGDKWKVTSIRFE